MPGTTEADHNNKTDNVKSRREKNYCKSEESESEREHGSRTIVPAGDGEERAHVRRAIALQELNGLDAHVVVVALLATGIQSTLGCVMTRGRIHTTYTQF